MQYGVGEKELFIRVLPKFPFLLNLIQEAIELTSRGLFMLISIHSISFKRVYFFI